MPDPLLPGDNDPPPPRSDRQSKITCDFCGCSLAPSGDVLRMSPEAKKFRDSSDTIAALENKLAAAERAVEDLKTQLKVFQDKTRDHSLHI